MLPRLACIPLFQECILLVIVVEDLIAIIRYLGLHVLFVAAVALRHVTFVVLFA